MDKLLKDIEYLTKERNKRQKLTWQAKYPEETEFIVEKIICIERRIRKLNIIKEYQMSQMGKN